MVSSNLALNHDYQHDSKPAMQYTELPQENVKWCTVSLSDVITAKKRLEATVFDVEGKHAREVIAGCKWKNAPLLQMTSNAYYPGRFKRIYSDQQNGEPFYLPSQMTDVYPKPDKYISALTKCDLSELRLKYGDILLTRSGTIGSVTVVSKTLENKVFSDDVIRITPKDNDTGFLYTYLRSTIGNTILKTNQYGSVIQHIEPEHLADIPVPCPSEKIKGRINDLIMRSFELRDESNAMIDEASEILVSELQLPPIYKLNAEKFDNNTDIDNFSVKLSSLAGRLDGSYHIPIVAAIKEKLCAHSAEVPTVGDKCISKSIILPGRFKRVYVEEGQGRVFFSGKNILELDPSDKKYLSFAQHNSKMQEELTIRKNMILITCSGVNLGKAALVPKHWDKWAMTHDIIRLVPDELLAGYLYIWLQSPYAYKLIQAMAYGTAVPHIEKIHIAKVPVPIIKDASAFCKINTLALQANELRYQAYQLEQEAMQIMDNEVIFA